MKTQKDLVYNWFFKKIELKGNDYSATQISLELKIPQPAARRILGELFKEGFLAKKAALDDSKPYNHLNYPTYYTNVLVMKKYVVSLKQKARRLKEKMARDKSHV